MRDLAVGGDAAVETDGGIVLVPGALPGEQVRIRPGPRKRGAQRGELLQVLQPSPERVEPSCTLQARCGGCPWMTLSLAAQHETKRGWVAEAVAAVADDTLDIAVTASPLDLGYRMRARLAYHAGGHPKLLGYRRRADRRVLNVPECPVLSRPLQAAVDAFRTTALPLLVGQGEIELGTGREGRAVARIRASASQPGPLYQALRELVSQGHLAGLLLSLEEGATEERIGEPEEWRTGLDGVDIVGAPGGFTQANDGTNAALVTWVVEAAEAQGTRLLELYAGHGNFTVALAAHAERLTAIEQHPGQARHCAENVKRRQLTGVKVVNADVTPLPSMSNIDVVVLDPPRTGAREVLDGVLALKPKRIVYVSCDPPTLARDLRLLHAGGYVADRAHAFDMFPHTAHIEAAVRMRRREHR